MIILSWENRVRLFVCSPYAGDVEKNVELAKWLCKKAIECGYAPFAPHLLYPQFLKDSAEERVAGIGCGHLFLVTCEVMWVWDEVLPTPGMQEDIVIGVRYEKTIVYVNSKTEFEGLRLKGL